MKRKRKSHKASKKQEAEAQIAVLHFTTHLLKDAAMQSVLKLYNHLQMFPDMTDAFAANRAYNELDRIGRMTKPDNRTKQTG
jgi:hypothetical protein